MQKGGILLAPLLAPFIPVELIVSSELLSALPFSSCVTCAQLVPGLLSDSWAMSCFMPLRL